MNEQIKTITNEIGNFMSRLLINNKDFTGESKKNCMFLNKISKFPLIKQLKLTLLLLFLLF